MGIDMMFAYQEWPYRQVFKFAREARHWAPLFVVHVREGEHIGRGECGLQSLKNETRESVVRQLEEIRTRLPSLRSREEMNLAIPASSARNAVDAALWDLECKKTGKSVWGLAGVVWAEKIEVDITIGMNSPEKMRSDAMAAVARGYRLLKIKANGDNVLNSVNAIVDVAPGTRLIVDANEAWSMEQLRALVPRLQAMNVVVIEQPLHHDHDAALEGYDSPIPICADESCATREGLNVLEQRYDAVNIKLDKTGGLTEALAFAREAKRRGLNLMMGCNGATSLGNAPAYVVGSLCDWRDIDSQELLYEDRAGGMTTRGGELYAFDCQLWG